jgi:hypothetical protein
MGEISPMLWLPFLVLGLAAAAAAWRPEWLSRRWLWLTVGLASLFSLGAHRLTAPWVSHHDFNAAVFNLAARSHLRLGWHVTGGADIWNGGSATPVELYRYLNHPPLIGWVLALPMSVLGVHEWVARLTVFIPVLAALVVLSLSWRPLAEAGPFLWLCAAAMPAFSYYGRMPGHEPLTIALLLVLVVLSEREPTRRGAAGIAAIGLLLPMASWAGSVFAGVGVVGLWVFRRRKAAAALAVGAAVGCALLLLFMFVARGGVFRSLLDQFLRRSSGGVTDNGVLIPSARGWVAQLLRHGNAVVGWPMAALALAGAVLSKRGELARPLAWLVGGALLLVTVLRQWSYMHDFSMAYLAIPALLAAAPAARALLRLPSRAGRVGTTLAVAAALAVHAVPELQARHNPILSARHEVKIAGLLQTLTAPTDLVAYAERLPSPIFLYYVDRDFLVWPNPLLVESRIRPKAFVQLHTAPPENPDFRRWLENYAPAAGVRGVWIRKEE